MPRILTTNNNAYEMNKIPDEVDDLQFAVLDNSNPEDPDYFFVPLIFLESFESSALVLNIANHIIKLPTDWKILIGEKEVGDLEMVNISNMNDRGFNAFGFNPLSSYVMSYFPINIIDLYSNIKWYFPKLEQGQILAIPIETGYNPQCIYCAKDINKQNEIVNINKLH